MAKNIIILGAGASVEIGGPSMSGFLDAARKVFTALDPGSSHWKSFDNVFKALSALQRTHSKSSLDFHNIESVFTTFEMAKTLGVFPGRKGDKNFDRWIDELIEDLKILIVLTLDQTVRYPTSHDAALYRLGDCIREIRSSESTAVLTFNYDLAMDLVLGEVDYGIWPEKGRNGIPLLKLHGSLNWGPGKRREKDKKGKVPMAYLYGVHHSMKPSQNPTDNWQRFNSFENIGNLRDMDELEDAPFIIPPSWNKAAAYRGISSVWARAAEELSGATSIYVIGYSLPETDTFFRQLYALGTVGDSLLERFWVFNPDVSREEVFRDLLGPGARQRFEFFPTTFGQSVDFLISSLEGEPVDVAGFRKDPASHTKESEFVAFASGN